MSQSIDTMQIDDDFAPGSLNWFNSFDWHKDFNENPSQYRCWQRAWEIHNERLEEAAEKEAAAEEEAEEEAAAREVEEIATREMTMEVEDTDSDKENANPFEAALGLHGGDNAVAATAPPTGQELVAEIARHQEHTANCRWCRATENQIAQDAQATRIDAAFHQLDKDLIKIRLHNIVQSLIVARYNASIARHAVAVEVGRVAVTDAVVEIERDAMENIQSLQEEAVTCVEAALADLNVIVNEGEGA
ncbi:hypothetical protein R3P38DRAFT_3356920 [Favolaschia claudopus]|uniref:Uncharacterized protein n=1 Tax=Favolaschia claudopus TaxID=2862362 RepID=A0AAW0BA01_9AGAR